MNLNNRQFNVRIVINKRGEVELGFVMGSYRVSKNLYEWREVPASVRKALAERISESVIESLGVR